MHYKMNAREHGHHETMQFSAVAHVDRCGIVHHLTNRVDVRCGVTEQRRRIRKPQTVDNIASEGQSGAAVAVSGTAGFYET